MLELIKRDVLTMEVSAYNEPWLPDPSVIVDAFKIYTTTAFDFWGEECFFACLNYVNVPDKPILFCFRQSQGEVIDTYPVGLPEIAPGKLIEWLHVQLEEAINGRRSHFFSKEISAWLKDEKYNPRLIVAPYVVQKNRMVETVLELVRNSEDAENAALHAAEMVYREMGGDINSFLYTATSLFPEGSKSFPDAFYSAALVVGVDLGKPGPDAEPSSIYENLHDMSETLSIKFQMSWGYPQLLTEKEKMVKREARYEQTTKDLERFRKASDVAKQLVSALGPAYATITQLNRMLKPLPSALLAEYRQVTPYIPPRDSVRYFDKWDFMHDWKVDDIKGGTESFRAQMACILLAYLGDIIPKPDASSWNLDSPWQRLFARRSELDLISRVLPNLQNTLAKLFSDNQTCNWCDEDMIVFRELKACFYAPFKTRSLQGTPISGYLTGPLLTLWTLENNGLLDDESRQWFFSGKAKSGDGWPSLEILPEIYTLVNLCEYEEKCELSVKAIKGESVRLAGVRIEMPVADEEKLTSLKKVLGGWKPADYDERDSVGNFLTAVSAIRAFEGNVNYSEPVHGLELTFPVK